MSVKRVAWLLSIFLCAAGAATAQTEWVEHPDNPVIGPGEPGAWDGQGHSAGTVLSDGERYHMWMAGRNEDGNNAIGHATSNDGVVWEMDPANPVLSRGADGEWDDDFLFAPVVLYDGTQFRMWYGGGDGSVQQVGYATSPDGTTWTKYAGNPVMGVAPSGSEDDWIVRAGSVLLEDVTYRMWFFGASNSTNTFHIGYAESPDGLQWTKHSAPALEPDVIPGSWEENVVANPFVAFDGERYHMWYPAGLDRQPPNGRVYIGYAFSHDGIEWTKHRFNPVIQTADNYAFMAAAVHDESGWHMWYSHSDETANRISYATSDCCPGVAAMNHTSFIPAAAFSSGAEGAFFQTDVDLSNAGSQPVEYQLKWLPRGEDNSNPMTSEIFSLGAGMSVRYANVLGEVFGLQPDSLGGLALLSTSSDLLSMSRIYNTPSGESAGTYGQAMPGVVTGDLIQSGERKRILFATEDDDMRTNVGCVNGGGSVVGINLELFDMEGNALATEMMILPPWGNDQLNRIFEEFVPITGYVEVSTRVQNRAFYCYGSVLDNLTSDPTTIPPQ
jgi:predicted GH43/DUF377 family glycosyl hydrolase